MKVVHRTQEEVLRWVSSTDTFPAIYSQNNKTSYTRNEIFYLCGSGHFQLKFQVDF